ncbi:MAG: ABC transporter permease subunit [Clostridia bacterium]|nr:ABC transporter permease subunit [Clostridia bacterium]
MMEPMSTKASATNGTPHLKGNYFTRLMQQYWRCRYLVLLLIPSVAVLIIFKYIPMYGVQIAFKNFKLKDGIVGSAWANPIFSVFQDVFAQPVFWNAFWNTLILGLMNLLVGFPMPIILALLLNELRHERYKKVVQTLSYLPHFISWVTLSGLFIQLLSPSTGPIAAITKALGGEPYYYMGRVETFRWVLVVTNIWKGVGWGSIIYLAALTGVDQEMYEAALIDGATRFQRVWYITLPSIFPTITIMLILQSGSILNDNFDQVYNMMNDAVYRVANVLGVYTYDLGLKNLSNAGLAKSTAVGLFKNVIALILVLTTNAISKKISDNGIW